MRLVSLVSAWPAPPPQLSARTPLSGLPLSLCVRPAVCARDSQGGDRPRPDPQPLPGPAPQGLESAFEPIMESLVQDAVRQRPSRHHGERFLAPGTARVFASASGESASHIQRRTAEQGHIDCGRCTPPIWFAGLDYLLYRPA